MLQAFPAEACSTLSAVNQCFSEVLRDGEGKSNSPAFGSPPLQSALAAVTRSILVNLVRAVLVRARGAKTASR